MPVYFFRKNVLAWRGVAWRGVAVAQDCLFRNAPPQRRSTAAFYRGFLSQFFTAAFYRITVPVSRH